MLKSKETIILDLIFKETVKEKEYLSASREYNYEEVRETASDSDLIALAIAAGREEKIIEIADDSLLQTFDKIFIFCQKNTDADSMISEIKEYVLLR